ncbi:uncharacterized protein PAC_12207 [Phialocephala subalpina]|uniref:RRM domain-containing protein n=1 Tax=Phialocephala subalpina TaxID=576137 RepID=A0A1L7XB90_9HELO|nr:uncharacterized protein PAC_12207 [Phialocephala subalpina]
MDTNKYDTLQERRKRMTGGSGSKSANTTSPQSPIVPNGLATWGVSPRGATPLNPRAQKGQRNFNTSWRLDRSLGIPTQQQELAPLAAPATTGTNSLTSFQTSRQTLPNSETHTIILSNVPRRAQIVSALPIRHSMMDQLSPLANVLRASNETQETSQKVDSGMSAFLVAFIASFAATSNSNTITRPADPTRPNPPKSEEDIVVFRGRHPVGIFQPIRQPVGPPPAMAAEDPRNFVRRGMGFPYRNLISSGGRDTIVHAAHSSSSDALGGGPSATLKLAGNGVHQDTASYPPQKYSNALSSWRATDSQLSNTNPATSSMRPSGLATSPSMSILPTLKPPTGLSASIRPSRSTTMLDRTTERDRSRFRPSRKWLAAHGLASGSTSATNYQGDPKSKSALATERGLPDKANCALWLTGLPGDITYPTIFDWLEYRSAGGVWALHINPPKDFHLGSAARLIFFEQENAQRLYDATQDPHSLFLDNCKVNVEFNREGNRRRDDVETRVLEIEGPTEKMSWSFWKSYFDKGIIYDLDRWFSLPCSFEEKAKIEIRFARVDGQAQKAIQKIQKDKDMDHIVQAYYKVDPCEGS